MASQLAALEEDRKQYQDQLDIVLTQLKDDAENAELRTLYEELNDMVTLLNESIAEQKAKQAPKPAVKEPTPPPPPKEKWSRENHPAFKKTAAPATDDDGKDKDKDEAPVTYQVNDNVLAKWVSGDKAYYPARITSITGSASAPIYIVKFKSYDTTETLRAKDIRPVSSKRKADGTPAAATGGAAAASANGPALPLPSASPSGSGAAAPATGVVASAAASVYPEQANAEGNADRAAKPKSKKIKANKELEAGKNKWQEFNHKSKYAKGHKKDSMFRTGEGVNARVGFTGSGQAMRKDPTRSRHIYQTNEEIE